MFYYAISRFWKSGADRRVARAVVDAMTSVVIELRCHFHDKLQDIARRDDRLRFWKVRFGLTLTASRVDCASIKKQPHPVLRNILQPLSSESPVDGLQYP